MQQSIAQIRVHKRCSIKYTKSLQRIFATFYFVSSFFDYLFLQRFTLGGFFDYLFLQRFTLRSFFDYLFRL